MCVEHLLREIDFQLTSFEGLENFVDIKQWSLIILAMDRWRFKFTHFGVIVGTWCITIKGGAHGTDCVCIAYRHTLALT